MSRLILIWLLLLSIVQVNAQQKDSAQTMKKFISICTKYRQQVPLHLSMEYNSIANVITRADDTANVTAEFYMVAKGAYMQFGEMEEIVNDSMALLVSGKMNRMFLYKDAQPVIAQLKAAMGMQVQKSSVEEWCKKFEVYKKAIGSNESIELISRNKLYNTNLFKESILMIYEASSMNPIEVVNLKRGLIRISQDDYDHYNADPLFAGKLYNISNAYYLVKEQKMMFTYKSINHNPGLALPVNIEDRIAKSNILNMIKYVPAKGFEKYVLTEE